MAFEPIEAELLYPLALEDRARNYFICYTINNGQPYKGAWQYTVDGVPVVGVFLRKTGIVQIAVKPGFDLRPIKIDLETLLSEMPWKQANLSLSQARFIREMPFNMVEKEGAFIAACTPSDYKPSGYAGALEIKALDVAHIDEIIALYQMVFHGFASRSYMIEKLIGGRGRAVGGFLDGKLIAVAQTDYESETSAIIVGVATHPSYQGKGYGRVCFESLSTDLINEGKTLYLQYDSKIAGALYESVGFKVVEEIVHIENQSFIL